VSHNRRVAAIALPVRVYGDPIMRTTVGPLPPAVYWRRRAVVLGAALLGIIVLFVSCTGNGKTNQGGKGASSTLPTPAPASSSPESDPSFVEGVPGGGGPSLPDPGSLESKQPGDGGDSTTGTSQPTTGTGSNTNVTVQSDATCTDSEISVVAIPAATTVKRATPVQLTLQVKNIGTRTCSRDVGSDPQELYLDQGARKYWSSDDCGASRGNDVRQFAPGAERSYKITWNGRQSSSCVSDVAAGPAPPQGQFDLRARLGTLVSDPVTITITT
jgi:archaellum component FlaG (FlaF/FlaG flagellin family)